MLKVLHAKAVAEPILLATTCHNMDLFAIVTRSLVVVYRSTTLTVVTTLPLVMKDKEMAVSACWSPSGRLLAVGLQSGDLYLLDVESGELIRRFVPRHGIALAIKSAHAKTLSGIADTPAEDDSNNRSGEEEDGGEDDIERDPLRQPPILPISVDGAIVACTWTSFAPRTPTMHSHNELCLPLSATISSPIFEELERQEDIPVLLVLDQKGGLSFLPGGMQEVGVVVMSLQWPLDPFCMRVEAFFVAATPPPAPGAHKNDSSGIWSEGGSTDFHAAYLVVRETGGQASPRPFSQVVRIHLSDTIARVTDREAVALCSIVEYCRMGKVSYQFVRKRWESLICAVRKDLLLPQNALLLRDTLMEDIAQPPLAEVTAYFERVDLEALVKDTEELSRQFAHLVLQVSNVAYRCYDLALHLSQAHSSDRQRQCMLMDVIGGLRQRCSNFLRQMRLELEREKDLVHWVLHRAAPTGTRPFTSLPSLRAARHPSLLRTLHHIARGESTVFFLADEDIARGEEELSYIVKGCLMGSRETVACLVPLLDDIAAESILQRQCEVLVTDTAVAGVESVQLHAVTVTQSHPCQPIMAIYALEPRGNAGLCFVTQHESPAVDVAPLRLAEAKATLLWSGVVDDGGRRVVLWERAAASVESADATLLVAVVDEAGVVEVAANAGENDREEEDEEEEARSAAEGEAELHYAVLEIKGISTRHLRASVSRVRGFGVFYAKERFVVVDFKCGFRRVVMGLSDG
ncbi:putative cell division cycle protein [Trypanosoma rangeli]|uniref:Putative cell division cycle protein n=1 Tax=Trypanosoma rangeli TaxID=5698 RepID=A0A3R7L065_TRYRA|nr:putative cell division cycle protein [Trypanosoma rangeli]RNF04922.1 putative cell division cycle protein [Trypanosoma rangeli]|eukprot:RNF04922.1 putative cell division cycle protein [Trypanosoma rangeli]